MTRVETNTGVNVFLDPERLKNMLGALAVRVTATGDVEAFLITEEGAGWVALEDCQLSSESAAAVKH